MTATRRKWFALALLCTVQFMVVLDIAVVNVALPSIQIDLGFSQENLQWVISAYALLFGGFLLLGGRAADLLGRRRVFLVGIVVFTPRRCCPGSRGARARSSSRAVCRASARRSSRRRRCRSSRRRSPKGRERNTALGAWGVVGAFGAVAGVLLGGVLTDLLDWRWIFYVNAPVGIGAFALVPVLLNESRDATAKSFDLAGAALVTSGLVVLVYAITQAPDYGWGSAETIGSSRPPSRCSRASSPARRGRATRSCRSRSSGCARWSARTSPG